MVWSGATGWGDLSGFAYGRANEEHCAEHPGDPGGSSSREGVSPSSNIAERCIHRSIYDERWVESAQLRVADREAAEAQQTSPRERRASSLGTSISPRKPFRPWRRDISGFCAVLAGNPDCEQTTMAGEPLPTRREFTG
jgi:hypothetical protein